MGFFFVSVGYHVYAEMQRIPLETSGWLDTRQIVTKKSPLRQKYRVAFRTLHKLAVVWIDKLYVM